MPDNPGTVASARTVTAKLQRRRQGLRGRTRRDLSCAGNVLHGITNTGHVPLTLYWSKWMAK
jgi:hypothetical protein